MKTALALLLLCAACAAPATKHAGKGQAADLAAPASWRIADCPHCPVELDAALAAEAAGHWVKAAELFADAIERDPACDRALLGRGRALMVLGRPGEAADLLATASEGRASAPRLLGARTCALFAAGRNAEVVQLAGGYDPATLPPDALVALGRAALLTGNYMIAGAALSRQVELQPADGGAWLDLARTLYLLKEEASGLYALRKAHDLGADLGGLQPLVDAGGRP
jgi:tetratricopeptide (TPR) repeat protein